MTFLTENETIVTMEETKQTSTGSALAKIRQEALNHFNDNGFPGKKDEDYKYMKLDAISNSDFNTGCAKSSTELDEKNIADFRIKDISNIIVISNGHVSEHLSNCKLPDGVIAGSILNHIDHPAVQKYFASIDNYKSNGFSANNTARFGDAVFVFVPKNVTVSDTIQILKISDNRNESLSTYNRVLIVLEENAEIKLVETNYSLGENTGINNSVNEIHCDENSRLRYSKIQLEKDSNYIIDNTSLIQKKQSDSRINTVSLGGNIMRNNLTIALRGQHCNSELYGFYVSSEDEQIDNHTSVHHDEPNCESTELYKGIATDKSIVTFNGKIFVKKDAQKTNAFQSNKNILLSDDATINTKPQLEIYADDVKCSHGATIGQMDNEALFYLRSRGISKEEATLLMIRAFAADVLSKIEIESLEKFLREQINLKVRTQ